MFEKLAPLKITTVTSSYAMTWRWNNHLALSATLVWVLFGIAVLLPSAITIILVTVTFFGDFQILGSKCHDLSMQMGCIYSCTLSVSSIVMAIVNPAYDQILVTLKSKDMAGEMNWCLRSSLCCPYVVLRTCFFGSLLCLCLFTTVLCYWLSTAPLFIFSNTSCMGIHWTVD